MQKKESTEKNRKMLHGQAQYTRPGCAARGPSRTDQNIGGPWNFVPSLF
jgi:hypothetical protein